MTGTALAQVVPVLAMPWLTRLYSPEDFGEMALFLQIAQFLLVLATGRYDQAIQLPRMHGHSVQLFAVSRLFTWFVSGACQVVVVAVFSFYPGPISHIYWLLPILVFAMSAVQQETQWLMRHRRFGIIARSKVAFVSSSVPARIALGYLGWGSLGLAVGTLLGQLVTWVMLSWAGLKLRVGTKYSKARMKVLAVTYKDFPLVTSFHALSDMGRELLMLYLIGFFFGKDSLGWYAVAFRIIRAPMMLIGTAMGQVFYQRVSEKVAHGQEIYTITRRTLRMLTVVGMPLFLVLGLLGESGFSFILGREYAEVGRIVQIMTPWLFLNLIIAPLSQLPLVLGLQRSFFKLALVGNALQVLAVVVGASLFGKEDIFSTLWLLTAVGVMYMLVNLVWILSMAKRSAR